MLHLHGQMTSEHSHSKTKPHFTNVITKGGGGAKLHLAPVEKQRTAQSICVPNVIL